MQWVDLVMLGVLSISIIVGLVRGFVFELLSLFGWVVSYFVARWFADDLAPYIPVGRPGGGLNLGASFALLFVVTLLAWAITSRLLRFLIHATPLSLPDRLLGAAFGLLRGFVVLLVATTLVTVTPLAKSAPWQASAGARWSVAALESLRPMLPLQLSNRLPAPVQVR